MDEIEEIDDVEKLIFIAETLSDKLAVVSHSHKLRYLAIECGLAITFIVGIGFAFLTFSGYEPQFRYGDAIFQLSPLLLIFSIYISATLLFAIYRLSLDQMYLRLVRERLGNAINDGYNLSKDPYFGSPNSSEYGSKVPA